MRQEKHGTNMRRNYDDDITKVEQSGGEMKTTYYERRQPENKTRAVDSQYRCHQNLWQVYDKILDLDKGKQLRHKQAERL